MRLSPPALTPLLAGPYCARLAATGAEVAAAQKLRFDVMYGEWGGEPDPLKKATGSDADEWDHCAYHIVVIDTRSEAVVGTLRLVSNLGLEQGQSFYTETAYDLSQLRSRYGKILELTRFCIDPAGRQGVILMLIWKFAMQFIAETRTEVMMGCASFAGTNPEAHAGVLHYLQRRYLAPDELRPVPIVSNHVHINDLVDPVEGEENAERRIPTLLRGYLKLGARISDTAVIDPVFNSTFICIYVDAANMQQERTVLVTARTAESEEVVGWGGIYPDPKNPDPKNPL